MDKREVKGEELRGKRLMTQNNQNVVCGPHLNPD